MIVRVLWLSIGILRLNMARVGADCLVVLEAENNAVRW